jgi:hypothetical protein
LRDIVYGVLGGGVQVEWVGDEVCVHAGAGVAIINQSLIIIIIIIRYVNIPAQAWALHPQS